MSNLSVLRTRLSGRKHRNRGGIDMTYIFFVPETPGYVTLHVGCLSRCCSSPAFYVSLIAYFVWIASFVFPDALRGDFYFRMRLG